MKSKHFITICTILLFFSGLNAQAFPKNGQVFSSEFHQGMDTIALVTTVDGKILRVIYRINRGSTIENSKNHSWFFYNDNQDAKTPISFTKRINSTYSSALWSQIDNRMGIRTTTVTPKHGTVICTFKVWEKKDRNYDNAGNKIIARITDFAFGINNKTRMVHKPAISLSFRLDENLNILTSVECEKSYSNISNYTYMANLGLQRNEWQTIAITHDCDKKQLIYFAKVKKLEYSKRACPATNILT